MQSVCSAELRQLAGALKILLKRQIIRPPL